MRRGIMFYFIFIPVLLILFLFLTISLSSCAILTVIDYCSKTTEVMISGLAFIVAVAAIIIATRTQKVIAVANAKPLLIINSSVLNTKEKSIKFYNGGTGTAVINNIVFYD